MIKNMTRKGLALGAGLALIGAGLVGMPAQASAVAVPGSIDLTPSTGPKDGFAVFSVDQKVIELTMSSILSGSTLKLLVTDPDGVVEPNLVVDTTPYATVASMPKDSNGALVSVASRKATVKVANNLNPGDKIYFTAGVVNITGDKLLIRADEVLTVGTASSTQFTIVEDVENETATDVKIKDNVDVKLVRTARSAGSYVVNTGVTSAGLTSVQFKLNSTSGDTYEATVQAFADADGDNRIAAGALNEFVSPLRTLTWVDPEDVVATTVIDAPIVGAQTLNATVTTEPVLNGVQNNVAGAIRITYTRQDSAAVGISANATQNLTTGAWTATPLTLNEGSLDVFDAAAGTASSASAGWGFTRAIAGTGATTVVVNKVATTTKAGHLLRVGDKVKFTKDDGDKDAALNDNTFTVTSVPSSSTFTFTVDRADTTQAIAHAYTVVTLADGNKSLVDGVFPGTYSARAVILVDTSKWAYAGPADVRGTFAVASAKTIVSTQGSANVQGVEYSTDAANEILVKRGESLTVPITATIVDSEGDAIGSGRSVALTINSASSDVRVNGRAVGSTLFTDSNGQVTFNVTSVAGANGTQADVSLVPEGVAGATTRFVVKWQTQAFSMTELGMTGTGITTPRVIAAGGSYDLQIGVMDQWFQAAPSADYRIKVDGSGVTEGFVNLVDGRASIKVTDNRIDPAKFTANVTLQKRGSTGLFADVAGSKVAMLHNIAPAAATLALAANNQTLYKATKTVTTSAVAAVALVELDKRLELKPTPAYKNNAVVTGKAFNGSTAAALPGSVVTISGPSSILFEEGLVAKRGNLTFLADGSGEFAVNLYSTTAQKDTVITVTANGVSREVKVTFTGIGVGEGTSLVITAPSNVQPSSTFQVKAKLSDQFGNGVTAPSPRIRVTYTGPGIVFGTLPTSTDANGELMFSVLLGANDTGNITVRVQYDQNGNGVFTDAKDLTATSTITIGTAAAATTGKVNVGSFNGKLVVYALGLDGARISWKVAGRWGVATAQGNVLNRFDRPVGAAGRDVIVEIYVDRVLTMTKTVRTR